MMSENFAKFLYVCFSWGPNSTCLSISYILVRRRRGISMMKCKTSTGVFSVNLTCRQLNNLEFIRRIRVAKTLNSFGGIAKQPGLRRHFHDVAHGAYFYRNMEELFRFQWNVQIPRSHTISQLQQTCLRDFLAGVIMHPWLSLGLTVNLDFRANEDKSVSISVVLQII